MTAKEEVLFYIDAKRDLVVDVSDRIWEFAETRFEEYKSAELLRTTLAAEGFTVDAAIPDLKTAFVATYGSGKPVIGILGEYDALYGLSQVAGSAKKLPLLEGGKGHGCGHHALGSSSLAAAIGIKEYLKARKMSGTVVYYGCPAEEGGSGKVYMLRSGCFKDTDIAFSCHPGSENYVTTFNMLATISVYFKFHGVGSHAAATPHLGRSALDAIELMNVGSNFLREHILPSARLHYAITDSGGMSPNVVQSSAAALYQIRAPRLSVAREIYERVVKIAQGAALMTETTLEIIFDRASSELFHCRKLESLVHAKMADLGPVAIDEEDHAFAREIRASLTKSDLENTERQLLDLFGEEGKKIAASIRGEDIQDKVYPFIPTDVVWPASTDVGDVSWVVPTAQFMYVAFAKDTPPHSWQEVAQGKSPLCHKGMLRAGEIMALAAVDLLENPGLVKEIKKEFLENHDGKSYVCPIPDEVKPSPRR
jgi:aminobenzoyl-glutamate utilization protein B